MLMDKTNPFRQYPSGSLPTKFDHWVESEKREDLLQSDQQRQQYYLQRKIILLANALHILTEYSQPHEPYIGFMNLLSTEFPRYVFEISVPTGDFLYLYHLEGEVWETSTYPLQHTSFHSMAPNPHVQSRLLTSEGCYVEDEKLLSKKLKFLMEIPIFGCSGFVGVCRIAWNNEASLHDQRLIMDLLKETGFAFEFIYKRAEATCLENEKIEEERKALISKFNQIGEMYASIAHELRNPMTTVSTYLQMLALDNRIDLKDYELMMEELSRANRLLSDFLSLARNDELHFEKWDINELLEHCLQLNQGQIKNHKITLEKSFECFPSTDVLIDPDKMKQIILNICNNALEAMEPGGILKVSSQIDSHDVRMQFTDNGPGIPPEYLCRLKEPFFTTKTNGTGLGIPVSCKLIKDHKGDLAIESEVGKGTTVTITLPLIG
ncbi:MAG: ATP-binding protein [Bacillota bacterium]|nr:ATP-binding protein [Bacillota bacterium]